MSLKTTQNKTPPLTFKRAVTLSHSQTQWQVVTLEKQTEGLFSLFSSTALILTPTSCQGWFHYNWKSRYMLFWLKFRSMVDYRNSNWFFFHSWCVLQYIKKHHMSTWRRSKTACSMEQDFKNTTQTGLSEPVSRMYSKHLCLSSWSQIKSLCPEL